MFVMTCAYFSEIFSASFCSRVRDGIKKIKEGGPDFEFTRFLSLSLYIVRVGNIFVRNIFSRLVGADFYDFLTTLLLWLLLLDEQFFFLLSLSKKDLMNY